MRDANRLRDDLLFALSRVPADGLIFSRPEIDLIAEALGGYTKLAALLRAEAGSDQGSLVAEQT